MRRSRLTLVLVTGFLALLILVVFVKREWVLGVLEATSDTDSDLDLVFEVALQVQDLPSGWARGNSVVEEAPGAVGRAYEFYPASSRDPFQWPKIIQYVFVYGSEEASTAGYEEIIRRLVPPTWPALQVENPETALTPNADVTRIHCAQVTADRTACSAVVRYRCVVSAVLGNLEPGWLTLDDFQNTLQAADRRIVAALEIE